MKPALRRAGWLFVAILGLAFFLRFGGTTVVVLNRAYQPICGLYVSTSPDERGPNRILTPIHISHSRDVHLPFLLNRFLPREQRRWYLWATDCAGADIDTLSLIGFPASTLLFEVNK